jgi:hypothetical protein
LMICFAVCLCDRCGILFRNPAYSPANVIVTRTGKRAGRPALGDPAAFWPGSTWH